MNYHRRKPPSYEWKDVLEALQPRNASECQDSFVRLLLKDPGFFLDIGCHWPVSCNNTYELEQEGWDGLLLDVEERFIESCKVVRKSRSFVRDCRTLDWLWFLQLNSAPTVIDFISLDVDFANGDVIQAFPLDRYQFKILAYETNRYMPDGDRMKAEADAVLSRYPQYRPMLENGQLDGGEVWEDWWINTDFIKVDFYRNNIRWKDFLTQLIQHLESTCQSS